MLKFKKESNFFFIFLYLIKPSLVAPSQGQRNVSQVLGKTLNPGWGGGGGESIG